MEKITYKGKIIEVVQTEISFGDKIKTFEMARRAPGTRLIVTTPEGNFMMTKEFRQELNGGEGGYDVRLAGGKVYDSLEEYSQALSDNVDIEKAAHAGGIKEAEEELGISPKDIKTLSVSHCGATIQWDLFYLQVDSYDKKDSQDLELGEDINIIELSPEEVWEKCINGEINEDRTVSVLMKMLAPMMRK
jgi:ADP-ribose pyrophosphatase